MSAPGLELAPGLNVWCPTCDTRLDVPSVTPDSELQPCFFMKADLHCGGCGQTHRLAIHLAPDIADT